MTRAIIDAGREPLRSVKDVAGAAIILLELDDFGARKIFFKIENVGKIGAAPRINRLPIVANHTNVAILVDEKFDELILDGVGVLILVD